MSKRWTMAGQIRILGIDGGKLCVLGVDLKRSEGRKLLDVLLRHRDVSGIRAT